MRLNFAKRLAKWIFPNTPPVQGMNIKMNYETKAPSLSEKINAVVVIKWDVVGVRVT